MINKQELMDRLYNLKYVKDCRLLADGTVSVDINDDDNFHINFEDGEVRITTSMDTGLMDLCVETRWENDTPIYIILETIVTMNCVIHRQGKIY